LIVSRLLALVLTGMFLLGLLERRDRTIFGWDMTRWLRLR
jgi:hypothetical protein